MTARRARRLVRSGPADMLTWHATTATATDAVAWTGADLAASCLPYWSALAMRDLPSWTAWAKVPGRWTIRAAGRRLPSPPGAPLRCGPPAHHVLMCPADRGDRRWAR